MNFKLYGFECVVFWFSIMLILSSFESGNAIASRKRPPDLRTGQVIDTVSRTEALYKKYILGKYPETIKSSIWIVDSDINPVSNATIVYSCDEQSFKDSVIYTNRADGLYEINDSFKGIVKVEVSAPGFESQTKYIIVHYNGIMRCKITLGKKGSIYLPSVYGFFPLTDPSEIVTLQLKSPELAKGDPLIMEQMMDTFYYEVNKLRLYLNDTLSTVSRFSNWINWPNEKECRQEFYKMIVENDVLKTDRLSVFGGCKSILFGFSEFWIKADTKELKILEVLKEHGFVITRIYKDGVSPHSQFYRVSTVYNRPMSLDFLRDIQKVHSELAVLCVLVDHSVDAESDSVKRN